MNTIVFSKRPLRRSDVWIRQAGQENAIYDPREQSVHLLNATALAIWQLCDGQTTVEEMVRAICDLCGMHRDIVVEDVDRVLTEFGRAGLITWSV
jgi:pyrroloquinoline quinone biosynthesis protein D